MKTHLLQPRPIEGRILRASFFNELMQYPEDLVAVSQLRHGLLPVGNGRQQPLAELDPADLVVVKAIHALGEHGHLLSLGPSDSSVSIEPYDCRNLSVGEHRLYVCLDSARQPCGEPTEVHQNMNKSKTHTVRGYQHNRIVLANERDRFTYRDWLQIAIISRVRYGGTVRTELNNRYHPPILTMAAYCRTNPLNSLIKKVFDIIDILPRTIETILLRSELEALRTLAPHGTPEAVFVQIQRCLNLFPLFQELADNPLVHLGNSGYSHDDFCEFLTQLHECVATNSFQPFPEILELDGERFHRLAGEFEESDDFWKWASGNNDFVVNALALYFPRGDTIEIPNIRYGLQKREQSRLLVARNAHELNSPGSAVIFEQLKGNIQELFIGVDALEYQQRLRMHLGEGHAVYYR